MKSLYRSYSSYRTFLA